MIKGIESVLKEHMPNVIQVAGHDHGLQMLMKDSIPYIVSGGGLNTSRVKTGKRTLYAAATTGFAILEVRKSGKIETKFLHNGSQNTETPSFTKEFKTTDYPRGTKICEGSCVAGFCCCNSKSKIKREWIQKIFLWKKLSL